MELRKQIEALRFILERNEVENGDIAESIPGGYHALARELMQLQHTLEIHEASQLKERSEYTEQLELANARLNTIIRNLKLGIILEDENRTIVLVNDKFCTLFGLPNDPESLVGNRELAHSGQLALMFRDPAAFESRTHALIEEKLGLQNEIWHLANGRIVQRDYVPVWNNGKYQGSLWMYTDITNKQVAEKKLQEQRQFYEDILNSIPADIAVFDADHRYLFANPEAIRNPYLREWIIHKTDVDYCRMRGKDPELARMRREQFQEALRQKRQVEWEEVLNDQNGGKMVFVRKMYPILDSNGTVKQVIGYGLDITDRKEFEEQLQLSEKRYRDLFNYSQAMICTHDTEGRMISVNPSLCKIMEYTAEELLGRSISEFVTADSEPLFRSHYLDTILQNGKAEGVFSVVSKSGKKIFLLYQNYKLEETGKESYIISFAQDITEMVYAERELRIAKEMTEETARAKEAFLANMSHEIRTPMNAVLGIAALLAKTALDDQQMNYLRLIQESANNMMVIVNDVLDLEKIIAGKLQFEFIAFCLKERVEMCVQSFTFKAEEKGIALAYHNEFADHVALIGDPYRLSQVLNNLLSNALKFTERGLVSVTTRMAERKDSRTWIEFVVKDSGIGIPEDKLAEIFEPFVQANSSVSRKYGGTGLGLSISKELIQLMGGTLEVNSEIGKGTTFHFKLPFEISSVMPNAMMNTSEINYGSLGKRKILVAEDVELNQYLARHIMESWGFEVDIAANGKEALQKVQEIAYDLVLMDIQMPEMDGMEATRGIRKLANEQVASVPIVALTANALKGDSEKYLAAGMNDYLAKPFDEEKLFLVISKNLHSFNKNSITMNENSNGGPARTDSVTPEEKMYDLAMVQSIANGDAGFVNRMLSLLMDTMPPTIDDLEQACASGDWNNVGKVAHKMKSTIDSLGISGLKTIIRSLEQNGKNGLSDPIPDQVKQVASTMRQCLAQIKKDYQL